jgi:hypothetical protein
VALISRTARPAAGRIIASIEDPVVIGKMLAHLEQAEPGSEVLRLLEEQDARLAALRKAIQEGVDSGPAEPFDFDAYSSAREGELKRG